MLIKEVYEKEKLTPYECGFSPIRKINNPFSIRFLLLAILFLVFELEIVYLFPWFWKYGEISQYAEQLWLFIIFIIVLSASLIYEWSAGGLEWE